MEATQLGSGDPVYHPKYGFGVIRGIRDHDIGHLVQESASGAAESYYEVDMAVGGSLFVPVGRAEMVGLRRLSNSLEAIFKCFRAASSALPEDSRERMADLRRCEQSREPQALREAVRDLVAIRRNCALTNPEKKWLDQACRRLSVEAAIVEGISESAAYAAILAAVEAATKPASVA
jgi:RNA polymerase-interacting CarD/CdnL/TRCF family regulator